MFLELCISLFLQGVSKRQRKVDCYRTTTAVRTSPSLVYAEQNRDNSQCNMSSAGGEAQV